MSGGKCYSISFPGHCSYILRNLIPHPKVQNLSTARRVTARLSLMSVLLRRRSWGIENWLREYFPRSEPATTPKFVDIICAPF